MILGEDHYGSQGEHYFWPKDYSSAKLAQKRIDKLEKAGIQCKLTGYNGGYIRFLGYTYLGMMRHFSSYNLRCKVMSRIGKEWWQVIYFAGHLEKVVLKKRYRQIECKKEEICNEIKELRRTV